MKRQLLFLAVILLTATQTTRAQQEIREKLDRLVREKLAPESEVGICVYDLTAKEYLYTYRAEKLCRPASNMKVLTVLTALGQPDAGEPFRTQAWYKGVVRDSVLHGDIYVVGGFDPLFNDSSMNKLADDVAAFPFSTIKGSVYGDVSMKDSLYWGSGWLWDDTPNSYQPYLSPLMFCQGVVEIVATPGPAGEPARLKATPASGFYSLTNETKSREPDAGTFNVTRNWLENKNDILVSGNVESKRTSTINMYRSQDLFMHTFVERLRARGIAVNGSYAFAEFVPDSTAVQMACLPQPVDEVIEEIMKESNNLAAEALLCKAAAHTGRKRISAGEGMEMIAELIRQTGRDPAAYNLADACGLSGYNLVSPALMVELLKHAYNGDSALFVKFYKSLPISGVDGTLKYRMKGTKAYMNIHAKTGAVSGISTLSGYAKAANGHELAFSVMNQNTLKNAKARAFQDMVCTALCE